MTWKDSIRKKDKAIYQEIKKAAMVLDDLIHNNEDIDYELLDKSMKENHPAGFGPIMGGLGMKSKKRREPHWLFALIDACTEIMKG
tara:strand:- start:26158 stop:26415 length:258 start_codon:yes stop_codon:yes gene_type:complete